MPNRILREGILSSEEVNSLSWEAEVFYRRLMSVVDDFGRFTANASLLRAALYPLKLEAVREANVERLLAAVEQARLVRLYSDQYGKRYLELRKFRQQKRATTSKYPDPPPEEEQVLRTCVASATHLIANAHLGVCGDVSVSSPPAKDRQTLEDAFSAFWELYPKKECKADAKKAFAKCKPELVMQALAVHRKRWESEERIRKFIPNAATWLNRKPWEDGPDELELEQQGTFDPITGHTYHRAA